MCEECERLRALLEEANDCVRLAYLEMARLENDGYRISKARFNKPRFDQVARALKAALERQQH